MKISENVLKVLPEILIVLGIITIVMVTSYLSIVIGLYVFGLTLLGAGLLFAKGRR